MKESSVAPQPVIDKIPQLPKEYPPMVRLNSADDISTNDVHDLAESRRRLDAANGIVDTEAWETNRGKLPPAAPTAPAHMRALPPPDKNKQLPLQTQPRLEKPDARPQLSSPEKQKQLEDMRERVKMLTGPGEQPLLPGPTKETGPRKIDLHVIDATAIVEQIAHREAEEKVNKYLNDNKNVGFFKRQLARMGEPGMRAKFYRESKEAILANRNLMATIEARLYDKGAEIVPSGSSEKSYQLLDEVWKTFDKGLAEKDEKGEKIENHAEINLEVAAILMRYARGQITSRDQFENEVEDRVIRPFLSHREFAKDNLGNKKSDEQGAMFASNLFKHAEDYKVDVEAAISEAEAKFGKENSVAIRNYVGSTIAVDVHLGKKERDLSSRYPEDQLRMIDKFVERAQSIPIIGKLMSPMLAGAVGSIAATFAIRGAASIAGRSGLMMAGAGALSAGSIATFNFAVPLIAATALGGGFAGMRRGTELKRDRGLEMRRESLGLNHGGDAGELLRAEASAAVLKAQEAEVAAKEAEESGAVNAPALRKEAKKTAREARSAMSKSAALAENASKIRKFNYDQLPAAAVIAELKAMDPANLTEEQKKRAAEILTLRDIEKENHVLMFSVPQSEGAELNSRLTSLNQLDLEINRVTGGRTAFREQMSDQVAQVRESKLAEITEKDKEFASFHKWEIAKAVVKGSIFGLIGGAVGKALFTVGSHALHDGLSSTARTLGAWLHEGPMALTKNLLGGEIITDHIITMPDGTKMTLPEGVMLTQSKTGEAILSDRWTGMPMTQVFNAHDADSLQRALDGAGFATESVKNVASAAEFSGSLHTQILNGGAHTVELPEGMSMVADGHGAFNIVNKAGKLIEQGIGFKADGHLTDAAKAAFQDHGWNTPREQIIDNVKHLDKQGVMHWLEDTFGKGHGKRIDYHANGTPMHTDPAHFDVATKLEPELGGGTVHQRVDGFVHLDDDAIGDPNIVVKAIKEHLVGADGKELQLKLLNRNGEYILSVKDMIQDMIKHGAKNWDGTHDDHFGHLANAVKSGRMEEIAAHMKLLLPGNVRVAFDANGEFHMPKGSTIAEIMVKKGGNGLNVTTGAIMERTVGGDYDQLATAVGHVKPVSIHDISSVIQIDHPPVDLDTTVTFLKAPPTQNYGAAFVTPFYGRYNMEDVDRGKKPSQEPAPKVPPAPPKPEPQPLKKFEAKLPEPKDPNKPPVQIKQTRISEALRPANDDVFRHQEGAQIIDLAEMRRRAEAAKPRRPAPPVKPEPVKATAEVPVAPPSAPVSPEPPPPPVPQPESVVPAKPEKKEVATFKKLRHPDESPKLLMHSNERTALNYKSLGVDPSISDKDLTKAYYKLALKYHSDRLKTMGAEDQAIGRNNFQVVSSAYNELLELRKAKADPGLKAA